jgi:hypothetical protein
MKDIVRYKGKLKKNPHISSDKERATQINRTIESHEDGRGFNLSFLLQERLNEKAHYDICLSNVTP